MSRLPPIAYVILAQNDDHVLLGDSRGEIRAVTQAQAAEMVERQMLPTGHLFYTPRDSIIIPANNSGRPQTQHDLKEMIDRQTGLSATAAFIPDVWPDEPHGVWAIKRPPELFIYHAA